VLVPASPDADEPLLEDPAPPDALPEEPPLEEEELAALPDEELLPLPEEELAPPLLETTEPLPDAAAPASGAPTLLAPPQALVKTNQERRDSAAPDLGVPTAR
jgi:hypothetical protein